MPDRNVTPMRGPIKVGTIVLIVIGVAVIALLSTSLFVVDQTEQAVVVTLGRFTKIAGLDYTQNCRLEFSETIMSRQRLYRQNNSA
ncbi:hypothetical protein MASR2M48_08330 [Spirochaetota bacterium]